MAGKRISDEQRVERLRAFKTFGSVKAASEAMGITRQAVKLGIDAAERRGLDKGGEARIPQVIC